MNDLKINACQITMRGYWSIKLQHGVAMGLLFMALMYVLAGNAYFCSEQQCVHFTYLY